MKINKELVTLSTIDLKKEDSIKETTIRDFLYKNPDVLGKVLGASNLQSFDFEKRQPNGGRLDLLFLDDEDIQYEVELQLGATDPSHIIRCIEYWDCEREHNPQREHFAVLIAENLTKRFFNVISLLRKSIPIIAIQLTAISLPENKVGISLIKILDLTDTCGENEHHAKEVEQNPEYWTIRSNSHMMKLLNNIFSELQSSVCQGYELKYNQQYIGLKQSGSPKNFITFIPQKSNVLLLIFCDEDPTIASYLSNSIDITRKDRRYYKLAIPDMDTFNKNKEYIKELIKSAKERMGI